MTLRDLGCGILFWLPNRCGECGSKRDTLQWLDGITLAYVCKPCAIRWGYAEYIPSLFEQIYGAL